MRQFLEEARSLTPGELAREVFNGFREHGLLLYAAAIAFRGALASIPFALFSVGVLGFLGLSDLYLSDVSPVLSTQMSPPAFTIVDDTITQVLTEGKVYWVTIGLLLTLWTVSSIVHAVMNALNAVYETKEKRPFLERERNAVLLALASIVLLMATVAVVQGGPFLIQSILGEGIAGKVLGAVISWLLGLALLLVLVGLLLRTGPDRSRPLGWVSFGAVLVVVSWMLMSVGFAIYVTSIANYESVFGALATAFIALQYLQLCAIVFLGGVQIDSVVREKLDSK